MPDAPVKSAPWGGIRSPQAQRVAARFGSLNGYVESWRQVGEVFKIRHPQPLRYLSHLRRGHVTAFF